jgi:serine/threonine-protein kinase
MQPGERTLGGRYALDSLLATGGMGQVWRGRDTVLRRDVAVKVLRSEYTGDPTFLARFRAEAQHTAGLTHPNIATLHDYGESGVGVPGGQRVAWLVMELVQGESLAAVLARGRLDPPRTAHLLRQAAAGLGAAHAAGVVHRDVKPGNLLVAADGTVKITDFGIARSASSAALTGTGQVIGTAHYLSPEQAAGHPAGPASDVYALGLVGYECLAGRRAFDGDNSLQVVVMQLQADPPPLPGDVPAPLRALVERALAKDPAQRFPDGTAMAAALDGVLAALGSGSADTVVLGPATAAPSTRVLPAAASPTPAPAPAGTAPAPGRPPGRGRRRALVALGALLVAGAVAVGVVQATGDGTPADPATTSEPAAPSEDPTVQVEAAGLVGRPVAEVAAELEALGLAVQLRPVRTADVPDGQVLTVDPAGALAPGAAVTVTHAAAPPPPSTAPPSTAPPSTAPPSTVPAPAPAPEEDEGDGEGNGDEGNQGNGNGNGRGNGNGNGGGDD